jgi:hypothetical protein
MSWRQTTQQTGRAHPGKRGGAGKSRRLAKQVGESDATMRVGKDPEDAHQRGAIGHEPPFYLTVGPRWIS